MIIQTAIRLAAEYGAGVTTAKIARVGASVRAQEAAAPARQARRYGWGPDGRAGGAPRLWSADP
jgi:hypothetical protein